MSIISNKEQNWDGFQGSYYSQYTEQVLPEDDFIEKFSVDNIVDLTLRHGISFGSIVQGIDVCNGGVAINPALMAPFIADNGHIEWGDFGLPQLNSAQQRITEGIHQPSPEWLQHEAVMARADRHWEGSMQRACRLGRVVGRDIFALPGEQWGFATCGYGPESITADPAEWEEAVTRFFRCVQVGGIALTQYMINSDGYSSAGEAYRSTPITTEDILSIARRELRDIRVGQVYTDKAARHADDPYSYDGMGVLVGIRK